VRKTLTALGLIVLVTAACQNGKGGSAEPGGTVPASSSPSASERAYSAPAPALETAGVAAAAAVHKIDVKLKMHNGQCVAEDPGATRVRRGDSVRWKYKNNCNQKKKQKIDRKNAPISGDCGQDTEVEAAQEKEGKDCTVNANAPQGTHKYGIAGDVALDPELDIPPPPPSPQPTPRAQ
jgi:plastocyanin